MKRNLLSSIRLFVLASLAVAVSAPSAKADVLVVGPGKVYTTIQAAVDAAAMGDTINVKAGTYNESVSISTNRLILRSIDGAGQAVIVGSGSAPAIQVSGNIGVMVWGFSIDGTGHYGIDHDSDTVTDPVTIIDNTITNCDYGAYFSFSYMEGSTFTFTGNTITNCSETGMYVYGFDGSTVVISDNDFTDCYTGLNVREISKGVPSDARISNNTITATEGFSGGYGIYSCCAEDTTRFTGNTITGAFEYGIYICCLGCCGPEPAILYVENNTITGSDYGIYFDDLTCCMPAKVYVRGNTIADNGTGIYVSNYSIPTGSTAVFTNNNIAGNSDWGFYNDSGRGVLADGNWWGDESGPSGEGTGTGDAISVNVIVTTWRDAVYISLSKSSGCSPSGASAGMMALLPLALALLAVAARKTSIGA